MKITIFTPLVIVLFCIGSVLELLKKTFTEEGSRKTGRWCGRNHFEWVAKWSWPDEYSIDSLKWGVGKMVIFQKERRRQF